VIGAIPRSKFLSSKFLIFIQLPGGYEAVQLRVAEQYITQFGELAKESNTMVLPATLSDIGSMLALAMNVIRRESAPAAR